MNKLKFTLSIALILIVTTISFYPALENNFVNWDDDLLVINNTDIYDLSWKNIKKIFTTVYSGNYIPITMFSYTIEYYFFELNPHAYHTSNLLLHLLNCLLVFWLIYLLAGNITISFLVAILFSVHPLHVESVAWIAARKDVLYTAFFLGSLISYLYYLQKDETLWFYSLSLCLFSFSLLSKSMAVTLPAVLLLFHYLFHQKISRKVLLKLAPFFMLAILFGILAVITQYSKGISKPEYSFSFLYNLFIASYGLLFYLSKIAMPIKLSCLYPFPENMAGSFNILPLSYLLSPLLVLLLAFLVFSFFRHNRKVIFGVLFFLIAILPVLQFLPVGWAIAADRYTYVPSIGLFFIFGVTAFWLYTSKIYTYRVLKILSFIIVGGLFTVLGYLTWQQSHIWHDSITLWSNVVKHYPRSAMAYNNRGGAYINMKEYNKAILDYTQALNVNPHYMVSFDNLLKTYWISGKREKAIDLYKNKVREYPYYSEAYTRLGLTYWQMGKVNDAIILYQILVEITPNDAGVHKNLALIYFNIKEYRLAIRHFDKVQELGYKIPQELLEYLKPYRQ